MRRAAGSELEGDFAYERAGTEKVVSFSSSASSTAPPIAATRSSYTPYIHDGVKFNSLVFYAKTLTAVHDTFVSISRDSRAALRQLSCCVADVDAALSEANKII